MLSRALLVLALVGCHSSDSLDLAHRDPRCVAACPETMPQIDGVGDVCDTASRVDCLNECEARIYGAASTCATCLTEDACFEPGNCGRDSNPIQCGNSMCTITGWAGSCSFPQGNDSAQLACEKQVSPRREVACAAEFKPVEQCASFCK